MTRVAVVTIAHGRHEHLASEPIDLVLADGRVVHRDG